MPPAPTTLVQNCLMRALTKQHLWQPGRSRSWSVRALGRRLRQHRRESSTGTPMPSRTRGARRDVLVVEDGDTSPSAADRCPAARDAVFVSARIRQFCNEVVGAGGIARQSARVAAQTRDLSFQLLAEIAHRFSPVCCEHGCAWRRSLTGTLIF